METDFSTLPPPGSDGACLAGCRCPVLDNSHGAGCYGGAKDENGDTLYWINVACPLHGASPVTPAESASS